jgi:Ca-activated chloride channel homolog
MTFMKPTPLRMLLLAVVVILATQAAFAQFTLKVGVDLVNVLFTVTDSKGRLISGLGPKDFSVEEDGRKQEILNFARENELPLTLALLIDTSPSVRPVFEEEKMTAVNFLRNIMRPTDLSLIIGFDRSVTLIQDYTDDVNSLETAIESLELGGGTSIFDAIYLACKEKLAQEAGRKAVILISDGADTTSKVKIAEALRAAHESNAVIYSISNSDRGFFNRRRGFGEGDPSTLKQFSEETGGAVFFLEGERDGFRKIFDQIAKELRAQYSLGYISTNTAKDGKYRRIKITPRDSKYKVQARKGYYAAKNLETQ